MSLLFFPAPREPLLPGSRTGPAGMAAPPPSPRLLVPGAHTALHRKYGGCLVS